MKAFIFGKELLLRSPLRCEAAVRSCASKIAKKWQPPSAAGGSRKAMETTHTQRPQAIHAAIAHVYSTRGSPNHQKSRWFKEQEQNMNQSDRGKGSLQRGSHDAVGDCQAY